MQIIACTQSHVALTALKVSLGLTRRETGRTDTGSVKARSVLNSIKLSLQTALYEDVMSWFGYV